MFLRPHHFQTEQRYWLHAQHRNSKWDLHHNWGIGAIALDADALANQRCVIHSLTARLRDGTLICVPEDGSLPEVEVKNALDQSAQVTLYLALPLVDLARANAAPGQGSEGERYRVDTQELEDENSGVNPQPIQVRHLNLRLLLSTQDRAGFEVIPIARIERSERADAPPQLDVTYIPPLLSCDAWQPLDVGIMKSVYHRIGKKIEVIANQVVSLGISYESNSQGDSILLAQLAVLNRAHARLRVLAFAQGIHPLTAYLELCELVGELSIFGPTRRPPELPTYDHDDLGGCFYRVKRYLDDLLDLLVEPVYKERPFVGVGMRMQVAMESAWLEPNWSMFIGMHSPLSTDVAVRLMTVPGQFDMKIGSSSRVDAIFRLGRAGLKFEYQPIPPRTLPAQPGLIYFQIRRDTRDEEWQNVQRSLTLALRFNENFVEGGIQGQRTLKMKVGTASAPIQFTLYLVPTT
jgi:type VI secretion system protein ImpJ